MKRAPPPGEHGGADGDPVGPGGPQVEDKCKGAEGGSHHPGGPGPGGLKRRERR